MLLLSSSVNEPGVAFVFEVEVCGAVNLEFLREAAPDPLQGSHCGLSQALDGKRWQH